MTSAVVSALNLFIDPLEFSGNDPVDPLVLAAQVAHASEEAHPRLFDVRFASFAEVLSYGACQELLE